jgi:hypothetical protein
MAHALPTNLGLNNVNAARLAPDATMTKALVLATDALIVLYRSEDLSAKQPITLRLKRSVVNRFWLGYLAKRPATDLVWTSQRNLKRIELDWVLWSLEQTK